MKHPRCAKCDGETQEGFLIDSNHHSVLVARWAEGAPSYGFLRMLRMRGRRRLAVSSWRCRKCGHLESFALEPAD